MRIIELAPAASEGGRIMARLIDADALKTKAIRCETFKLYDAPVFLKAVGTKEIDKAPTVDAVPVVRCKDCKWLYDEMDDYCCRSHRGLVRICENSFCSYGERKDGDGNG